MRKYINAINRLIHKLPQLKLHDYDHCIYKLLLTFIRSHLLTHVNLNRYRAHFFLTERFSEKSLCERNNRLREPNYFKVCINLISYKVLI